MIVDHVINACACRTARKGCAAPQDLCLFGRSVRLPTICHLGKQKIERSRSPKGIQRIGQCNCANSLLPSSATSTAVWRILGRVSLTSSPDKFKSLSYGCRTENEQLPAGHQVAGTHGL